MKKEICCIGAGYVGGPSMSVIAYKCPEYKVNVVDSNIERIKAWNGPIENLPIYEPGLKEIVNGVRGKNLFFSNEVNEKIKSSDIIFIAVNTPTKLQGVGKGMAADLKNIRKCAKLIAELSDTDKIIVEKSTAPVGTCKEIKAVLKSINSKNKFTVISNPEFLAEGTAIKDLINPDRVLIGGENNRAGKKAIEIISKIYKNWVSEEKILTTNLWSSELSKLASNAFLAQRISSINSLSALCEKTGAKIDEVSLAVGLDSRIGSKFLKSSVGFGGSCFKKDILNLVYLCRFYKLYEVASYWEQVLKINDFQVKRFSIKIIESLGADYAIPKITILGWAFKKDTNDSRESASIEVSKNLLKQNIHLNIYDPMVSREKILNDLNAIPVKLHKNINIYSSLDSALDDSYGIAVLTEWDEFTKVDFSKKIKKLKKPIVFIDGRNIIDLSKIKGKFKKIYSLDS